MIPMKRFLLVPSWPCQSAIDDYITALFAIGLGLTPDFGWTEGMSCGPLPGQNDYKLWPHLPGFKFLTATGTRAHYLDTSADRQAADVLPRPNGNRSVEPQQVHNPMADELRRQARELIALADKLEKPAA